MSPTDTDLTNDLRNLWTLVTAQPGIASRAIADELEVTHSRALKLIDILLASGTLTREPGKVGTLRATVPMVVIEGIKAGDTVYYRPDRYSRYQSVVKLIYFSAVGEKAAQLENGQVYLLRNLQKVSE